MRHVAGAELGPDTGTATSSCAGTRLCAAVPGSKGTVCYSVFPVRSNVVHCRCCIFQCVTVAVCCTHARARAHTHTHAHTRSLSLSHTQTEYDPTAPQLDPSYQQQQQQAYQYSAPNQQQQQQPPPQQQQPPQQQVKIPRRQLSAKFR